MVSQMQDLNLEFVILDKAVDGLEEAQGEVFLLSNLVYQAEHVLLNQLWLYTLGCDLRCVSPDVILDLAICIVVSHRDEIHWCILFIITCLKMKPIH